SSKSAYSIKRTALGFKALPLLKGNFIISKVKFKNAKFTLARNKNGKWNFADILAILPEPEENFYSDWPEQIIAKNSELLIIDKLSDNMWVLENADIKFSKRLSYHGGSLNISWRGAFKGSGFKNLFVSKNVYGTIKSDFKGDNLASTLGELELKDSICNDLLLKTIHLQWNFFKLNTKKEQNLKAEFKMEEISIPNIDNSFRKNILKTLTAISKIYGIRDKKTHHLKFKNISAKASFHEDLFKIQDFKFDSNILNLKADFALNNKTDKINLNFKGIALNKEMDITAKGLPDNLYIKPTFSYTIRTKIVSFIKALTKSVKIGIKKIDNKKSEIRSKEQKEKLQKNPHNSIFT
ncbi:MAG: hypothetical protein U9Q34_07870, partial [Elusimicrobiota bacterium]|nr:hypothetical protein [Elusimicrobiota bacterium]